MVGGFLETRVREENASAIISSMLPGWRFDSNYSFSDIGRIWIVWDPQVSLIVFKRTKQVILCGIQLPGLSTSFMVAFVYGRNTKHERSALWEEITELNRTSPLGDFPWVLVGDFNQIAAINEHFSVIPSNISLRGIDDFQNCLQDNDLVDLTYKGAFHTWSNHRQEDPILRKLDRALVNQIWLSTFPDSEAVFDPPGDSDHSPCIVTVQPSMEMSRKGFKYFSFFSTHPNFHNLLSQAWNDPTCVGSKLFSLGAKLKAAKACCKKLNKEGFGNIQSKTKEALGRLESIQRQLMSNPSDRLFREEHVARKTWNFFAAALESFYRQKSRIRWLSEGDANTRFFHKAVLSHQSRNAIKYLRREDNSVEEDSSRVKDMIVQFYSLLLGTPDSETNPLSVERICELQPFRCSSELALKVASIPSEAEIIQTFFAMPTNKAPGPDGFSVEFFKESWPIVKEDTLNVVKEFFVSAHLPPRYNATAIALIPKENGADSLSKFRPVSCCNTVYKIITRMISNRLKMFISEAVQGNQVGFIKGRLLCENVLLASELVLNILMALDLPRVFVEWIKVCITSPSYSIVYNGELIGFFKGRKGIRQGDPMSSHLFVLVMDVLARLLDKGVMEGRFSPHPRCLAPFITHLSFTDDILVFFDGSESSLEGILSILEEFKVASGLGMNRTKTALFIDGGDANETASIAERQGITHGSLPVRYLGVPLMSQKMRSQDFQPLIDRIKQRITNWTVKHLSFAGRLQLLKSVLYSTVNFWASIFLLPNRCLKRLEQICSSFLWSGAPNSARGAKISWDTVCTPKVAGGLGLRRLHKWNEVFGLKLIWLHFTSSGSLWVSWLRLNLIRNRCFWTLNPARDGSWIWRKLCKLRQLARPFISCEVGSGITALFWHDDWTGLGPIIDLTGSRCPLVSGLASNAVVREGLRGRSWWFEASRSRSPILVLLRQALPDPAAICDSEVDDLFVWKNNQQNVSTSFSASLTWEYLNPPGPQVSWHAAVWFKGCIPKHAFISWVTAWKRLHTRDRLRSWGLQVPADCLLCSGHIESHQHLFFECCYSREIWVAFTSRASVNPPTLLLQCFTWLKAPSQNRNLNLILRFLFQACIYLVWKERNLRLHLGLSRPSSAIISEIRLLIRARLDPLSRAQRIGVPRESPLATWIRFFDS